ncbi:putative serine protease 47 [Lynx rufus]|uniref:putative serine protease 47 n=1 Tax=Lynx rufus TaxID=61384 RepID=UPI001F123447|nr:putative serine protease 47 [Lynx rufus]XP_046956374.1 putative serine protease 47 [Lynx rufus]
MGEEGPTPRGRGWLAALLRLLLLLATGIRGSWPVVARVPAPAPVEAATEGRGRQAGGARRLALGAVCGRPKVTGKIYGGQDVLAGQWPWQASLLYQHKHICGAVLIDSPWLVSTAHCFLNKSQAPADYQVLLGSTRLYQHGQHTREMSVSRIVVHPDFEKLHPFGSDITMLQLHVPVNFTSYVAPACLPSPGLQLSSNVSCWITGWGMLSEDQHLHSPFHLQEGKVSLIENKFCNILYRKLSNSKTYSVQEEMLCAGDFSTGKATCHGDSGGPLVCNLLSAWVLVGLASWGLDCRHPIYPSVFTRVDYFTDWIDKIRRLTPPPDPTSAPRTQFPDQPWQTAGSSGHSTTLMSPQTWFLLLFVLRGPQRALW